MQTTKTRTHRKKEYVEYWNIPQIGSPTQNRVILSADCLRSSVCQPNPLYAQLIQNGLNATTPFTASEERYSYSKGSIVETCIYPGPNRGLQRINTFCGLLVYRPSGSILNSQVVAEARNRAAIGIRKAIRDNQTKVSGLVFLGELRESIHMIKHPLEALSKKTSNFLHDMRNIKNYQFHGAKHKKDKQAFGKVLADTWLEYSFGAAPLISDIGNIVDVISATAGEDRIMRLSFTGHAESATCTRALNGSGSGYMVNYSRVDTNEAHVRYLVGLRVKKQEWHNSLDRVKALGGFNLSEVIPTAWELLPWSFFIDYFSNIGDVITANLVSLEDVVWVCETTRTKQTVKVNSGAQVAPHSGLSISGSFPSSIATRTEMKRVAADIPLGTLRFELPASTNKVMNMLALFRTTRKG